MDDVYERFLSLAQRELAADEVKLLGPDEVPPQEKNVVTTRLRDGRHVVAIFGRMPKDASALTRRLTILADTFADALGGSPSERTKARLPILGSLHDELKALAQRARALDAAVIDADSPVLWGCASVAARPRAPHSNFLREASDRELSYQQQDERPSASLRAVPAPDSGPREEPTAPTGNLRVAPPPDSGDRDRDEKLARGPTSEYASKDPALDEEPELTRRAIGLIRHLPSLALLHKGRHVRELSRGEPAYLVLSFSSIYLLCLVFDGEFDELRAERAAHESLPRIERLVLALPPLDPDPQPAGGVAALRRPGRR